MDSLAFECPPAETGQVGLGAGFIEKDQLGRVQARLPLAPETPRPSDIRTVLFAGTESLFLYVSPIFPSTTLMACKEHFSPVACRNSFKVRSLFLANKERI